MKKVSVALSIIFARCKYYTEVSSLGHPVPDSQYLQFTDSLNTANIENISPLYISIFDLICLVN